jgi:predicted enzyme related to lactoylglutathione lyase
MEPIDADRKQAVDNLKINYIELPAQDFDATQAFYEGAFAWRFTDYGPEYRAFNDGSLDGGFYKSEKHSSTESGAALVILYAQNLEAALDSVSRAGGTIVIGIFDFPGGRRFQFTDPNGNQLAVWSDK